MTTEEKAKAYEMALEAARKELGVDRKEWQVVQQVLHNIFPELRESESEDERIRKEIISALKFANYDGVYDKHIAWLEKKKYDRMKPIYDARESFESALEKAWNDYHNGYENVDKLEDDYVECAHAKGFREGYLFGIEKQKEQNEDVPLQPIIYNEQGEVLAEQKPKEPGYKHEDYFCERCQANAFNAGRESVQKEQKPTATINGEPIPTENQSVDIPLAEWSEEDERRYLSCLHRLGTGNPSQPETVNSKWFKEHVHSRPSWKPSEEQMEALESATENCAYSEYQDCLRELIKQLKNL